MPIQIVQSRGQLTLTREVRRSAGIQPGDVVLTRVLGPGTVEIRRLPKLSLADLLERFRIEGPVDESRDQVIWEQGAAREVLHDSDA